MYRINKNSQIERIEDSLVIENTTSQEYLDYISWYNLGNEPLPYTLNEGNVISTENFLKLFTDSEITALLASYKDDIILEKLKFRLDTVDSVILDSEEVVQGVGYLVYKGILTQQRANEFLTINL